MTDVDHIIWPLKTTPIRPGWARVSGRAFKVYSARVNEIITVPVGFEFDWDSLPRWLPVLYAWLKDRTNTAACLHDWLYYSGRFDKTTTELIFLDFMTLEGVKRRHRVPIFLGVLIGGYAPWRKYRNGAGAARYSPPKRSSTRGG